MKPETKFVPISLMLVATILTCGCSSAAKTPDNLRVLAVAPAAAPDPAADPAHLDLIKRAGHLGYHVEVVNSKPRYCRTEAAVGSNIPHRECLSESQLRDRMRDNEQQNTRFELLSHGLCVTAACQAHP
jgi:hypothetical protein